MIYSSFYLLAKHLAKEYTIEIFATTNFFFQINNRSEFRSQKNQIAEEKTVLESLIHEHHSFDDQTLPLCFALLDIK